jgi:opacity protein-like surface antigen
MPRLLLPILFALAGALPAQAGDSYVSLRVGAAYSSGIDESLVAVNHPTRCDVLLYRGTGEQPPADPACRTDTPARLWGNSFALGTGSVAGAALGRTGRWVRYELEYLHAGLGSDRALAGGAATNAAFAGKQSEWSSADLPTEQLSDHSIDQLFANVYSDLHNGTRWTPFVGAGVGYARVSTRYYVRWTRKAIPDYLAIEFDPDWPDAAKRAAAGTVSVLDTRISQTVPGFQILAGVDYALSDAVSVGAVGRWVQLGDVDHRAQFDTVRSHAPVRADGVTPFDVDVALGNLDYVAVTLSLKYRF